MASKMKSSFGECLEREMSGIWDDEESQYALKTGMKIGTK